MKKIIYISFTIILFSSIIISCSKIKKTDAEIEREQWINGFTDSIEYYQGVKQQVEQQLDVLNQEVASMLQNFEVINNPREVTGYYLLKGWRKRIPFTSTGIYLRVNENEKLELIATLGGGTFNRLGVEVGSSVLFSDAVPHDQAFNYRHETYNTVYFSGEKADSIAEFISSHKSQKLTLDFLEGSKKHSFIIPSDEKDMISTTWNLYSKQIEIKRLQKDLWIDSKKIETFRRILDMENAHESNINNQENN